MVPEEGCGVKRGDPRACFQVGRKTQWEGEVSAVGRMTPSPGEDARGMLQAGAPWETGHLQMG